MNIAALLKGVIVAEDLIQLAALAIEKYTLVKSLQEKARAEGRELNEADWAALDADLAQSKAIAKKSLGL